MHIILNAKFVSQSLFKKASTKGVSRCACIVFDVPKEDGIRTHTSEATACQVSRNQCGQCGQSYKHFTLVNYYSRAVIWGNFKSGMTLES